MVFYRFLLLSLISLQIAYAENNSLKDFFTMQYIKAVEGFWGPVQSASGPGSSLNQTEKVRSFLRYLITDYAITSILDAPCGDCYWISHVLKDFPHCLYYGIDIVDPLIKENCRIYGTPSRIFLSRNLLTDSLPKVDLIIARDFLVHLSDSDIAKALAQFKKSGSLYLLTTTFPTRHNYNITSGDWRPLNLSRPPFNLPEPLVIIAEGCTEQNGAYRDKSLALWLLDDITLPEHYTY